MVDLYHHQVLLLFLSNICEMYNSHNYCCNNTHKNYSTFSSTTWYYK